MEFIHEKVARWSPSAAVKMAHLEEWLVSDQRVASRPDQVLRLMLLAAQAFVYRYMCILQCQKVSLLPQALVIACRSCKMQMVHCQMEGIDVHE